MSFTTMNMFGPRIWGFDSGDQEMQIARRAGWSRADLVWERLMEAGNRAWLDGKPGKAARLFRQADFLARLRFDRTDLRLATSSANLARFAMHQGKADRAREYQCNALEIWLSAATRIATMTIAPRSRSSLFHLRMEALHRETFHDNIRVRMGRFATETKETLQCLTAKPPAPHRHFARWRGERPGIFDDTRKILGACLLIADLPDAGIGGGQIIAANLDQNVIDP